MHRMFLMQANVPLSIKDRCWMLDVSHRRRQSMKIYTENFQKLISLLPSLLTEAGEFKLTALGIGDVEVHIGKRGANKIELRLRHLLATYDGSIIPDPDVVATVYPQAQTVGVVTYEDCFGHRRVHCEKLMAFSPSAQRELNHLFGQWLTKLLTENRKLALKEALEN